MKWHFTYIGKKVGGFHMGNPYGLGDGSYSVVFLTVLETFEKINQHVFIIAGKTRRSQLLKLFLVAVRRKSNTHVRGRGIIFSLH